MAINIGINGFGRIGRLVFRSAINNDDFNVVSVNDLLNIDHLAYLLKYDSVHGPFDGSVEVSENRLVINGSDRKDYSKKIIKVSNLGDHRICMSSAVIALLTGANAVIKNFETVYTSSPSFLKIMKKLGAKFEIQK